MKSLSSSRFRGFTTIESLVVIAIMGALFFVLAPPMFYRLGWSTPPAKDVDFEIRDVEHPTAPRVPPKFLEQTQEEIGE